MSAQFGRCNFDGKPVDLQDLHRVRPLLVPFGPDAEGRYCKGPVGVIHCALRSTQESMREIQPRVSTSGAVFTWDGRLDNRAELVDDIGGELSNDSSDVSIVVAAYERGGPASFSKLLGDWALSIWDPPGNRLILAKDPIGTRHLYYSIDKELVTWSSALDPLVLFAGTPFVLCEEYIAGWFSFFPAAHLTPFQGIHSVPPSSFVLLSRGKQTIKKYWDFDPGTRIHYRSDGEYEEHFRSAFETAVRRRLRAEGPILAELSGGMDSSAIVCMADMIIARGEAPTSRLDTVSYFDDSEPNWNERPYFAKIEEKRGRQGCHIDLGSRKVFPFEFEGGQFTATPAYLSQTDEVSRQFARCIASQNYRVLLSGIGGDEVTGGIPTPTPLLEDLLISGCLSELAHQLKVWALNKRKPWFHLLAEAALGFLPCSLVGVLDSARNTPWINPNFVRRNRAALQGYQGRLRIFGPRPSFQENIHTLEALRRQLGCSRLPSAPSYEVHYPYLDRSFLEFLYAIPRDQLTRPGQRRSLMRRALAGIVPDEILHRRRKAFVARSPMAAISANWTTLAEFSRHLISAELGIVNPTAFSRALREGCRGTEIPTAVLMRTVGVEIWLRNLNHQNQDARVPFIAWPESSLTNGKTMDERFSQKSSAS